MATVSAHMGTRVARAHNRRDERVVRRECHIDVNGHYEVWEDVDPRLTYEYLFGKAVDEYNEKQKRSDRKIDDYYEHMKKSKQQNTVYEVIYGVYKSGLKMEEKREILKEVYESFEGRNPNLEVCGAYFHADEEGEPHLHLDFVPHATYERGLKKRAGLSKALEQQGLIASFEAKTPQIAFCLQEQKNLERLARERGLEIEHPDAKRGVQHLETEAFKRKGDIDREISYLNKEKDEMMKKVSDAVKKAEIASEELQRTLEKGVVESSKKKIFKREKIEVDKEEWESAKEKIEHISERERELFESKVKINFAKERIEKLLKGTEKMWNEVFQVKHDLENEIKAMVEEKIKTLDFKSKGLELDYIIKKGLYEDYKSKEKELRLEAVAKAYPEVQRWMKDERVKASLLERIGGQKDVNAGMNEVEVIKKEIKNVNIPNEYKERLALEKEQEIER